MKDFLRKNGILILVIALLVAAILGVLSAIFDLSPLSNLLGTITSPFRAAANAMADWIEYQYNYAYSYDDLVEENEMLRTRLAELQRELTAALDANRQNERLRELIGLAERHKEFQFEDAMITDRSVSNWNSIVTINKGSNVGIEPNDCVVDEYGNLAGVVSQVGLNWAEVATLVDPSIELGARLPRTDEEAVLEGDFTLMLDGKMKLSYLPEGCVPIAGDQVLTSGLGDLYPAGLLMGTVESLHEEDSGFTRYAVVTPAADIGQMRYVYVIKSFDVVE